MVRDGLRSIPSCQINSLRYVIVLPNLSYFSDKLRLCESIHKGDDRVKEDGAEPEVPAGGVGCDTFPSWLCHSCT